MADEFQIRGPSVSGPPIPMTDYKSEDSSPAESTNKDAVIKPPTVEEQPETNVNDPLLQVGATGLGAIYGYGERKEYKDIQRAARERQLFLEALKQMSEQSARQAEEAAALAGQTSAERAIQGARDPITGTTGRAREVTFNTETARQAAVRRGVDNPFTGGTWGATDQGVLGPLDVVNKENALAAQRQANLARAALRQQQIVNLVKAPLSVVLDVLTRSKLAGAASGALAGYEGMEAYQAAKEGRKLDALTSGLSALGGVIGTIPTPPTVAAGAALGIAPLAIRGMMEEKERNAPAIQRYQNLQAPTQAEIDAAKAAGAAKSIR